MTVSRSLLEDSFAQTLYRIGYNVSYLKDLPSCEVPIDNGKSPFEK
jgi:hypothetical protein